MDNSALFTFLIVVAGIVGLFVLITVLKTMYTVRTYTAGIVERFGKFNRIARPGLQFLVPWCETVRFIDLQVRQAVGQRRNQNQRQCLRHHSRLRAIPGCRREGF